MATYPNAIYSPREKENKEGVEYDPTKKTTLFAEDVVKDDDEIVAIETELGTLPKGAKADVKTRLNDVDTLVATKTTMAEVLAQADIADAIAKKHTNLFKIKTTTFDLSTASGDVSYTGIGFVPSVILCLVADESGVNSFLSNGFAQNTTAYCNAQGYDGGGRWGVGLISLKIASGAYQDAIVKSLNADGFTLTWTKTGSPTGTARLIFLCFK